MTQTANDKQRIEPMLERLGGLPEDLGAPETLPADSGYFSAANVRRPAPRRRSRR